MGLRVLGVGLASIGVATMLMKWAPVYTATGPKSQMIAAVWFALGVLLLVAGVQLYATRSKRAHRSRQPHHRHHRRH